MILAPAPKICLQVASYVTLGLNPEGFSLSFTGPPFASKEVIIAWVHAYAHKKALPMLSLPLDHLLPFTKQVLMRLQTIPFGQRLSYAAVLDDPRLARAVGGACGRNPYPLFIPCHRVVAARSLGGFSLPLAIKHELLQFEALAC